MFDIIFIIRRHRIRQFNSLGTEGVCYCFLQNKSEIGSMRHFLNSRQFYRKQTFLISERIDCLSSNIIWFILIIDPLLNILDRISQQMTQHRYGMTLSCAIGTVNPEWFMIVNVVTTHWFKYCFQYIVKLFIGDEWFPLSLFFFCDVVCCFPCTQLDDFVVSCSHDVIYFLYKNRVIILLRMNSLYSAFCRSSHNSSSNFAYKRCSWRYFADGVCPLIGGRFSSFQTKW